MTDWGDIYPLCSLKLHFQVPSKDPNRTPLDDSALTKLFGLWHGIYKQTPREDVPQDKNLTLNGSHQSLCQKPIVKSFPMVT